jgi:hypothetical protein
MAERTTSPSASAGVDHLRLLHLLLRRVPHPLLRACLTKLDPSPHVWPTRRTTSVYRRFRTVNRDFWMIYHDFIRFSKKSSNFDIWIWTEFRLILPKFVKFVETGEERYWESYRYCDPWHAVEIGSLNEQSVEQTDAPLGWFISWLSSLSSWPHISFLFLSWPQPSNSSHHQYTTSSLQTHQH